MKKRKEKKKINQKGSEKNIYDISLFFPYFCHLEYLFISLFAFYLNEIEGTCAE